jgi:cytochrome c oxidase assembly protein subunit 19
MAPDSFKNLGFGDDSDSSATATATSPQLSQPKGQDKPRGS